MGFNIGPRVLRATGGSISRAGNYRIHQFPPEIVTDGLVIHLDTGNVGSLAVNDPTTIVDLTGNGNNGALTNGAAYQHYYGGTIYMNPSSSTDDYINVTNGGSDVMAKNFTIDFWLRPENANTSYQNIWSTQGYNDGSNGFAFYTYNNEIRLWGHPTTGGGNALMLPISNMMVASEWHNLVVTRDINTKELICYKNGAQVGIYTGCTNDSYEKDGDGTYSFGARDGSSYPFDGYTSGMRGYNRALSATEVLQNYEATKLRHSTSYSSTFNPTCAGSGGKVDVLCIAGGGGGGTQHGGGGGAGGYIETTGLTIASGGTYTAVVGAGGTGSEAGGSLNRPNGTNGHNSVFSGTSITTMTSIGGGGGSSLASANTAGSAGGSGGGGALEGSGGSGSVAGGAGTSGQGFAGGDHFGHTGSGTYGGGAGGGGAGSVGQDGQSSKNASAPYTAGAGGSGKTSSITGSPVTRAGGGGGGSHDPDTYGVGGSGGGGKGGLGNATSTANGDNAIPRTGSGGGGGAAYTEPGGCGAHGIIILRYPAEDYNVEMLIVGGGGGGGANSDVNGSAGGGAGAGGLLYYESYAVKSGKNYIVEVGVGGAGGLGANIPESRGKNGIPSKFGDLIALGGGAGAGGYDGTVADGRNDGQVGGSGGGGGSNGGTPAAGKGLGGKGTSGQGNDGGNGSDGSGSDGAGGGGGAGAVGGDGVGGTGTAQGGAGGAGLAYSITGTSTYYAGGGGGGGHTNDSDSGGGDGGNGGGGAGGHVNLVGNAATANTGGGGGGAGCRSGSDIGGGLGGSGIVIIAYKGPQRGDGGTVSTTSRPGYTVHTFTDSGANLFIA